MLQELSATECNWLQDGHRGCKCQTGRNVVQELAILLLHVLLWALLDLQLVIFYLHRATTQRAARNAIVQYYLN